MARIPSPNRSDFARECMSAWGATNFGVVPKNTQDRQKYWRHWCAYAAHCRIDPFLNPATVGPMERDLIVGAFAARVRRGVYGLKGQVRVGTVSDALSAISKTIELAGKRSPLYRADTKYQLVIERQLEGYRRLDPPSVPQLAVPVSIAKTAFLQGIRRTDKDNAIGCLVITAFYFLLRVGEYTKPRTVMQTKAT